MRKPTVLCCGQVPRFNEKIGELEHVAFLEEIDMPPARLKKYDVFRAFKYAGTILFCLLPVIWLPSAIIAGDAWPFLLRILCVGQFLASLFFYLLGTSGCEDLQTDTNIDNYPEVSQKWQAQAEEAYRLEAEYKKAHAEAIIISNALRTHSPADTEKLWAMIKELSQKN